MNTYYCDGPDCERSVTLAAGDDLVVDTDWIENENSYCYCSEQCQRDRLAEYAAA